MFHVEQCYFVIPNLSQMLENGMDLFIIKNTGLL